MRAIFRLIFVHIFTICKDVVNLKQNQIYLSQTKVEHILATKCKDSKKKSILQQLFYKVKKRVPQRLIFESIGGGLIVFFVDF